MLDPPWVVCILVLTRSLKYVVLLFEFHGHIWMYGSSLIATSLRIRLGVQWHKVTASQICMVMVLNNWQIFSSWIRALLGFYPVLFRVASTEIWGGLASLKELLFQNFLEHKKPDIPEVLSICSPDDFICRSEHSAPLQIRLLSVPILFYMVPQWEQISCSELI